MADIYVLSSMLAFLLAIYGTPLAREAALRFGVVDAPDGRLKNQEEPVPYMGGLAIYIAVLIPLCLLYTFDSRILAILLSGTLVLLLGLIDDFGVLTPTAKLLGQIIAATVLIKGEVLIHVASFPFWVNLTLTFLWIIGMTNAMNIIDIMDGLAAGVAIVASFVLFIVAVINNHTMIAIFTLTLTGSLAGFLRYNFRPAKIYMGDAGSMFLGLSLGALAIIGDYSAHNRLAFFNPLMIFGVALFDTVYVMILRTAKGRSMFLGSKDHFALRLKVKGWPVVRIVIFSYVVTTILGGLALWNMYMEPSQSLVIYGSILLFFLAMGIWLARIRMT
ncbi:MAG TPA: MraY family glycosyltransferase [Acidobacteriota bacterium]|nr:MraY family glycosyltransferase [Acidobacteriota bacterium]